jgi:hypothetical protein
MSWKMSWNRKCQRWDGIKFDGIKFDGINWGTSWGKSWDNTSTRRRFRETNVKEISF